MIIIRNQIMEIGIDNLTMNEAVDAAMQYINSKQKCRVITPNSEIAQMCKNDAGLRDIINKSQLVLPDGIGVIYAAKILGKPLKEKVAGVEFGENLIAAMAEQGKSLFLLGAKPGVADKAANNLMKKYPKLIIAGTMNGYYKSDSEAIDAVNAASPDALFVFLGAPKQEQFIALRGDMMNTTLMAGLGGSVDIWAGEAERAPDIFIKFGLEWLHRLLKQPQRIFRMLKLPCYLFGAFVYKLRGSKND